MHSAGHRERAQTASMSLTLYSAEQPITIRDEAQNGDRLFIVRALLLAVTVRMRAAVIHYSDYFTIISWIKAERNSFGKR